MDARRPAQFPCCSTVGDRPRAFFHARKDGKLATKRRRWAHQLQSSSGTERFSCAYSYTNQGAELAPLLSFWLRPSQTGRRPHPFQWRRRKKVLARTKIGFAPSADQTVSFRILIHIMRGIVQWICVWNLKPLLEPFTPSDLSGTTLLAY